MDKYLLAVIVLIIISISVIFYIKLKNRDVFNPKEKVENTEGDNFTLLE